MMYLSSHKKLMLMLHINANKPKIYKYNLPFLRSCDKTSAAVRLITFEIKRGQLFWLAKMAARYTASASP